MKLEHLRRPQGTPRDNRARLVEKVKLDKLYQ